MYKQERSKGEHEFVATEIRWTPLSASISLPWLNSFEPDPATTVYCLLFDPSPGGDTFPAVDFCHILASVSAYQESYTLLDSSCYWFAGMVMKMVEDCFTVKQTRGDKDVSGRYRGVNIFHPDPVAMHDTIIQGEAKKDDPSRPSSKRFQ
ncbi:hypothetical protein BU17DRAFT_64358 [Hysterangium stoloniferum]|nr:hypothetical protein BU17DRAFT_64358 [Hysterangium stoloniferum]